MALVRCETDGPVAVITLARPPVNALSGELVADLATAIEQVSDPEIRAVVVTGHPHFAVGADISEFQAGYESGDPGALGTRLTEVVAGLEGLAKPVIAAIHGYALGGGLEVALGCDFRFLADDATVGQPEIRLGLIPGAGGTQRLARLVPLGVARDLVYSGRMVPAAEALEIGLADRVVPAADLDEAALDAARQWATSPTQAIGAAKRAINGGLGLALADALALESAEFESIFDTEDAREGVTAFLEKRDPRFSGR